MKRSILAIFCILFLNNLVYTTYVFTPYVTEAGDPIEIYLSGYIKPEGYFDSRQVIGEADNQFLLFPAPDLPDPNGKDINAHSSFNMVAIESRLRAEFYGPPIKSAQAHGVMEADYFGTALPELMDRLRMRLAYVQIDKDPITLIFGQNWNGVFILDCYPHTVSFNYGSPFELYSRAAQVYVEYHLTPDISIITTACEEVQLQFISDGPQGLSSTYMHNAVVPNLHIQLRGYHNESMFGAAFDYKRLVPRLETNTGYKAYESINSVAAFAYGKAVVDPLTLRAKIIFVQNGTDYLSLGGYAVHSIEPVTDRRTYANLQAVTGWLDLDFNYHNWLKPGLFIGYGKNLGATDSIIPAITDAQGNVIEDLVYGIGTNTSTNWRVSPRVRWEINNLTFAWEVEYSHADYGTLNSHGVAVNKTNVGNLRVLFAFFYNF